MKLTTQRALACGDMNHAHADHGNGAVDVVVVHETNGRKYLEALVELQRRGSIRSLSFVEASVLWKFAHSVLRERRPVRAALAQAWRNLTFAVTSSRLRNKVIVICVPPWDFRFLFHARLRRHNRVIYNTSWPHWSAHRVPRRGGVAGAYLKRKWLEVLRDRNVGLIAVTAAASDDLARVVGGKTPAVIPHVVGDVFFEGRASYNKPFRLLFVGELVEKRGLRKLAEVLDCLKDEAVILDVVGDGPMRDLAAELASKTGGKWHSHVSNRRELSRIMSSCQLMVSPAQKTERWEELFGMAIVEAMACGLPCIVANHVGPRSIIESGVSGILLGDNSPSAIADEVRHFLRDEQSWNAMSAASRKRAETFRLHDVASRWEQHLQMAADDVPESGLAERFV